MTLDWPAKHTCHQQTDAAFTNTISQNEFRPPRDGQTFPTCDYCGSMQPKALFDALEAPATRLELADMKYGWPHKFYVHGIPDPNGGTELAGFDANGSPAYGPRSQHAKFYNVHLMDLPAETFQALADRIAQRCNVRFKQDPQGLIYGPDTPPVNAPGSTSNPASPAS